MTGLRELFEDAVGTPPPSHVLAGEVYTAGRRRHRLRTTLAAAAALVAGVLMVGGGLLLPGRASQSLPPAGDPTTPPAATGAPVQWAGAADAAHLYLARMACAKPSLSCLKTTVQLRGSGDGGRTWTDRGTPLDAFRLAVAGPETLLASVFAGGGDRTLTASTDGGRTWAPLREAPAVDALPAGSVAACWARSGEPCTLWAVDPAGRRLAPLRHQPDLLASPDDLLPPGEGGRIWVRGNDVATGRPAVAVSADAGRSWSVRAFPDAPACSPGSCLPAYLATGGSRAYAVAVGATARAVYRYAADGHWEPVTGAGAVPAGHLGAGGHAFVAADGTHVLCETVPQPDGRDGCRFWAGRDGTYQEADLAGLPATVYQIRRAADGSFYTHSYTTDRLYVSADGWTWSAR